MGVLDGNEIQSVNSWLLYIWQDDHLWSFGQIQHIIVLSGNPIFPVDLYVTHGIE